MDPEAVTGAAERPSGPGDPATPGDRRGGRPGPFRRRVVRPLAWIAAALALLCLAASVALRSPAMRERGRAYLVERLEGWLGREVEVDALDFTLLPVSVEVRGLRVLGAVPGEPPFLSVERLIVGADPSGLGEGVVRLREVLVERPELFLEFREDGTSNVPRVRAEGRGGRRGFALHIGTLQVEEGSVRLEQERVPLSLAAQAVRVRGIGAGESAARLEVTAQDLEVTLPRARPYLGALSLEGTVRPGQVDITAGRVTGPELDAEVSGSFRWGEGEGEGDRALHLEGTAEAGPSLLARLGYLDGQLGGSFRFAGELDWRPGAWRVEGRATSSALLLAGRQVSGVRADLSADAAEVRLLFREARYGEGALTGSFAIDRSSAESRGELDLVFEGVALERVLVDQDIPLEHVAGDLSGTLRYRFDLASPRHGDGEAAVRLRARPQSGEVTLEGATRLAIAGGVLEAAQVELGSSAHALEASGSYDLEERRGRFDLRLRTRQVEELTRLLPGGEGPETPLWRPTAGRGTFEGALVLGPEGAEAEGGFELFDVAAPGGRADRARGEMRVTRGGLETLRLDLTRDQSSLSLAGSIPFEGLLGTAPPLDLDLTSAGWPLDEAWPWLPFKLPVGGPVSGTLHLEGDIEAPTGVVVAEVAPAQLPGLAIRQAAVRLSFNPRAVEVEGVRLADAAGEAEIAGRYDPVSEALDLALEARALDLSRDPFAAFGAGGLTGRLDVAGRLGGNLEAPRLTLRLDGRELALLGRPLGEGGRAAVEATWDGSRLAAAGSLFGLVAVSGGGRLDREGMALTVSFASDDLRLLAGLLVEGPLPEFRGAFPGEAELARDFASGAGAAARLRLDVLDLVYAERRMELAEPARARLEGQRLILDSLYLREEASGSEVFLGGGVGLADGRPLDLHAQLSLTPDWLALLVPGPQPEGQVDVLATIRGTTADPAISGQGEVRGARLIFEDLPYAVENLRGTVLVYPEQLVVDYLEADVAGGAAWATGKVDLFGPEGTIEGYRLQLAGQGLALRWEGWLLRGGAALQLASTPEGRTLSGTIALDRALYLEDVKLGLGQLLARLFGRERMEVEETDERLTSTQLNLLVLGPDALRIRNNLADLTGDMQLTVRGSLARPVLFGSVDVDPEGKLVYAGNEYAVVRGRLSFANPYRVEPVLDLVAATRVDEFDVTLNLSGPPERLNATFSSDPPLADLEVLALLTTGRRPEATFAEQASESEAAAAARTFLYGQAASLVAGRVNTLFGFDKLQIDPLTSTSGDLSTARVTLGKRLSRDLYATYAYDPTDTSAQVLQVEWQATPGFTLILTQNGDGSYAVDGRWERRF